MDNLPTHKAQTIEAALQAVRASVPYLSLYSPEFNPIEHW
jgi:transposase